MIIKNRKKKIENNSPFLNERILFSPVLLVNNEEKKIVTRQIALRQAKEAGLDLLCVSPLANPPVCKLVNYYQLSKKLKGKKKEIKDKEVNISFNIEKNDLAVKLNKINNWTEKGSTVKVNLVRKGKERSREKSEMALEKCHRIIAELQNNFPRIELKGNVRQHLGNLHFLLYKKKQ